MTMRVLWLTALLLCGASCVSPVAISDAPCPCPAGYCCGARNVCVPQATCSPGGGAGSGGVDANDGPTPSAGDGPGDGGGAGAAPPDGRDGAVVPSTRLSGDDEVIVGFLPSGNALATLRAPGANLVIHRLGGGPSDVSTVAVDPASLRFAATADVVTARSVLWTDAQGFTALDGQAVALSNDGRFVATLKAQPAAVSVYGTDGPDGGAVAPVRTDAVHEPSVSATFSADGKFVYILDGDPTSTRRALLRGRTDGFAADVVTDPDAVGDAPVALLSGSDAIWRARGGIYHWAAMWLQPTFLVKLHSPSGALAGVTSAHVYYIDVGDPPMSTYRALSGGTTEIFLAGATLALSGASPDGKYGLMHSFANPASAVQIVDLVAPQTLASLGSCVDHEHPYDGAPVGPAFTPDSRHVVGGRFPCGVREDGGAGAADLVAVDLDTGDVRTLAPGALTAAPIPLDSNLVVFVAPPSGAGAADLMLAAIDGGRAPELLVAGIDAVVAVHGRTIAYSVHGAADRAGVYTIDVR
jgi:hypothetical protein